MDNFSNLMVINECLLDERRVHLFSKAIMSSVKCGDVVLDAGSGSGIMSFFAVKAGAKRVYAVEIDPVIAEIIRRNVKSLGYSKLVKVINMDVKQLPTIRADVIIMEMLDTWLAAEQQLPAMNSLISRGCVQSSTKIIPERVENYIQLVSYDFDFYGFEMPQPVQARNFGVMKRVRRIFSDPTLVDKLDLRIYNPLDRFCEVAICVEEDGFLNAAILRTKTFLTDSIATWGTTDMNMPVIIPLKPLFVDKGQELRVSVSYKAAYGFNNVFVKINV